MNIPVQIFSVTDTDGKITPFKFRFRDESQEIITVEHVEILKRNKTVILLSYQCELVLFGKKWEYILCYHIQNHVWFLKK